MSETVQQTPGLLGEDEAQKLRQQAQISGLLNFGANLLANSGKTQQPMSFGQRLAPALLGGYGAAQGTLEDQQKMLAARAKALEPQYEKIKSASGADVLLRKDRLGGLTRAEIPGMNPATDFKPIDLSQETRGWMLNTFGTPNFEALDKTQQATALKYEDTLKNRRSSLTGGINLNAMPLGKEGTNVVDKDLLNLGRSRMELQRSASQFSPEYLTVPFQTKMNIAAGKERVGLSLNEEDKKQLADYSQFRQTSMNSLNQYINQITGAAVGSGNEEARLRSATPDPQKDSPTEFQSKLNNTIALGRMFEARLGYVKRNGLKLTDVSIDQIPAKMRAREAEIIQKFNLDPAKPGDKAAIRTKLSEEFGLLE
jgi:hypothetical protein